MEDFLNIMCEMWYTIHILKLIRVRQGENDASK